MSGQTMEERQAARPAGCACAYYKDGGTDSYMCGLHADRDPCESVSLVTGKRRKGSIVNGLCTWCGWTDSAGSPVLVETIDGKGFPNVYVYAYRGRLFGVHHSWRSSPAEWTVLERDTAGRWITPDVGGLRFHSWSTVTTRKSAISLAEYVIDKALEPVAVAS